MLDIITYLTNFATLDELKNISQSCKYLRNYIYNIFYEDYIFTVDYEYIEYYYNKDEKSSIYDYYINFKHVKIINCIQEDILIKNICLVTLVLEGNFNQPINNLPNSLQNLTLGRNFDQPINNLPNSL